MKVFKRLLTLTLVLCMLLSSVAVVNAAGNIRVKLDGQFLTFDTEPLIVGGRTMVPLRGIFEALGATVLWDNTTRTVTSFNEETIVKCTIGENEMYVNNEVRVMDIAPMIIEGRTLVPARFVAEAFDCDVQWDANNRIVNITSAAYSKPAPQPDLDLDIPNLSDLFYPESTLPRYEYCAEGELINETSGYTDSGDKYYNYMYSSTLDEKQVYVDFIETIGWEYYDSEVLDDYSVWYMSFEDEMVGVYFYFGEDRVSITYIVP